MDLWTAETVRAMVRYISDDARIARHVGCSEKEVAAIRRTQPGRGRSARNEPTQTEVRHVANEGWMRDARRGSDKLAAALAVAKNN